MQVVATRTGLGKIRGNGGLMLQIYSLFLPTVDRFRLGGVDKEFHEDELRGHVVEGVCVYGSSNLSITEAFEEVRAWFMMTPGTPWSLFCDLYDEVDLIDEIVGQLEYASWYRDAVRTKLATIEADIGKLLPFPPHNVLFDIMKKIGMYTVPFLRAREPRSNYDKQDMDYVFAIAINASDTSGGTIRSLNHLRPSQKYTFQDANGVLVHKFIPNLRWLPFFSLITQREYCEDFLGDAGEHRCPDCATEYM
jgi:hypothetical protein